MPLFLPPPASISLDESNLIAYYSVSVICDCGGVLPVCVLLGYAVFYGLVEALMAC